MPRFARFLVCLLISFVVTACFAKVLTTNSQVTACKEEKTEVKARQLQACASSPHKGLSASEVAASFAALRLSRPSFSSSKEASLAAHEAPQAASNSNQPKAKEAKNDPDLAGKPKEAAKQAPALALAGLLAGEAKPSALGLSKLSSDFSSLTSSSDFMANLGLSSLAKPLGQSEQKASLGLSNLGGPALSLGGQDEVFFQTRSLASQKDAFPPFFGEEETDQPANKAASSLLGTWTAQGAGQYLELSFFNGGHCLLVVNGQKNEGSYTVAQSSLILRFGAGEPRKFNFQLAGDVLSLENGPRLLRKKAAPSQGQDIFGQGQGPIQGPSAQASLEGAWVAGDGQTMVIMMFSKGICGLTINGQQIFGPYSVEGNILKVQFNNGRVLNLAFSIDGNTLRLADGTVLIRQNLPGAMPEPQFQGPSGPSPLEGAWSTSLPNGFVLTFVFQGQSYTCYNNGQKIEAGNFVLNGPRLEFTVTFGQNQGQSGVNFWAVEGQVLILTLANGQKIALQKQS